MTLFSDGISIGHVFLLTPACDGCGSRIKMVPGYGDPLTGHRVKWKCPNDCRPDQYRAKVMPK